MIVRVRWLLLEAFVRPFLEGSNRALFDLIEKVALAVLDPDFTFEALPQNLDMILEITLLVIPDV